MDVADIGELLLDSNFTNLTESELLEIMLGPKHLPIKVVLPLTIVYVTIFVTGVFGNVVTCLVIIRNPKMQTPTNYYLFSLAISDLTLLVLGLPNELSLFWEQYPWALGLGLCKIRSYVSEMSSYVSVLTIVAFSMERYLAICHPLHLYAMSGLKRPIRFILAAWSVALVCAIPFAVYTTVNYIDYPYGSGNHSEDSAFCAMTLTSIPNFPIYELSCVVFFLVPMAIILIVYTRMGLQIRSSTRNILGQTVDGHGESRHIQSRKAVIRMLSAVVIMFFLCWAPFHSQRLLYVYGQDFTWYADVNEWLYTLSGCLYYFSTTVNPILYNVMSAKYRGAFKEMLCSVRRGNAPPSKDTSSFRETLVCQCDSRDGAQLMQIRSPRYPRSVRCTIDHAKELLRTPKLVYGNKGGISPGSHLARRLQAEQSLTMEPLLAQRSSESSRRPLEPSDSTASSTL